METHLLQVSTRLEELTRQIMDLRGDGEERRPQMKAALPRAADVEGASKNCTGKPGLHDAALLELERNGIRAHEVIVDRIQPAACLNLVSQAPFADAPQGSQHFHDFNELQLRKGFSELVSEGSVQEMAFSHRTGIVKKRSSLGIQHARKCFNVKIPFNPGSRIPLLFNMVAILALMYDAIMVPYQIAFGPTITKDMQVALNFLQFALVTFWTLDMLLLFLTSYYRGNQLVSDLRLIARHYLQTFFFLDLMVLCGDWLLAFAEELSANDAEDGRSWYSPRTLKVLRILKLNRALRIYAMMRTGVFAQIHVTLLNYARKTGWASQFFFTANILKLVLLILYLNHLGCCTWHAVGGEATQQWIGSSLPEAQREAWDRDGWMKYGVGYYWAMTSMVSGASVIPPTCVPELLFAVFYILFGLIFGSSLISSLAAMLMDLQMKRKDREDKLKLMWQYLGQQRVDSALCMSIEKEICERMVPVQRVQADEVSVLALLSSEKRAMLLDHIYGSSVRSQPFFLMCQGLEPLFVKDLCFDALELHTHSPGNFLFKPREECHHMIFLHWGEAEYKFFADWAKRRRSEDNAAHEESAAFSNAPSVDLFQAVEEAFGSVEEANIDIVQKGKWISELALWTNWQHRGSLEAMSTCEVTTVRHDAFLSVASRYEMVGEFARLYGQSLISALKREPSWDKLSDLQVPFQHYSLVTTLPVDFRIQMSQVHVDRLIDDMERNNHFGWGTKKKEKGVTKLKEEIQQGICDLAVDEQEEVIRLVSVVAIRIMQPGGLMLAQLGRIEEGEVKAGKCTLPGAKVKALELPADALERILKVELGVFGGTIQYEMRQVVTEEEFSAALGVRTRYVRTIYDGECSIDDIEFPAPLPTRVRDSPSTSSIIGSPMRRRRQVLSGKLRSLQSKFPGKAETSKLESLMHMCDKYDCYRIGAHVCAWMELEDFDMLAGSGLLGSEFVRYWLAGLEVLDMSQPEECPCNVSEGVHMPEDEGNAHHLTTQERQRKASVGAGG